VSQDNVDVIGRIYSVWAKEGSPVPSGLLDPGMNWAEPAGAMEDVQIDEILDAGDQVVVLVSLHGSGSDPDVERRQGYLWTLREGKVVGFERFDSPDAAMRAAGVHC
jgi:hypothetical protein